MDFEFHPPRCRNLTRRAGISPDAPPLPPLDSRPTPGGGAGRQQGRGAGGEGQQPSPPPGPPLPLRGEGSGVGAGTGGVAWGALQPPEPPELPRRFQYILAYIITSEYIPQRCSIHQIHPLLGLQYSRQYILHIHHLIHPDTLQYIIQYILP